jgi:hypothetical protein
MKSCYYIDLDMENLEQLWITKENILWSNLVLTVLLLLAISLVARHYEITLLDGVSSPTKAREILTKMNAAQRKVHMWITSTLDVAFPLSYGLLFAGSALRFFPEYGFYLALPAVLGVGIDLIEGVIQVLALTSRADFLGLKQYVTPLKLGLFIVGLTIALLGLLRWLFN